MTGDGESCGCRGPLAGGGLVLLALLVLAGPASALDVRRIAVEPFDAVHFSGAGEVRLSQGGPARLEVHGAAGALEGLEVEQRGATLFIESDGRARDLVIDLGFESLQTLVNKGQGHITGEGLRVEALRLEGHGAGSFHLAGLVAKRLTVRSRGTTRFELSGLVGRQIVELSGSGAYRAEQLISNHTTVTVAGTSALRLWADELLDVHVAGSADIRYLGSARVEQHVSGRASVLRIPQIAI